MKPICLLQCAYAFIGLLLTSTIALAQNDTTFFDAKWQKTSREHASFFRSPAVLQDDGLYHITDYFMSGPVQMTGSFANKSCTIEEGYFIHYDSLGHKTYEGLVHNGIRTGEWKFYFLFSDQLKRTAHYATDLLNGHAVNYDSASGKKKLEGDYCADMKCGEWREYHPHSDTVRFIMPYTEGRMDGAVKSFYPDGKLKREDLYRAGKFISGKCYTPDGQKTKHTLFYKAPQFNGDPIAFFQKHLRYPQEAAENGVSDFVTISFTVGTDGNISDVKATAGPEYGCREEAERAVKLMPRWKPAELEGEVMEDRIKRRIHFPFKFEIVD